MTIEEAPDRAGRETGPVLAFEQVGEFDQRDVNLRLDRAQDHLTLNFNTAFEKAV